MTHGDLTRLGDLLRRRNAIDAEIAALINRPMTGHLGEWIAADIFNIELERSASATAFDGRFRAGPCTGKTVNIKWYLKRDGVLDMTASEALDFDLVMTCPPSPATSSADGVRPWCIRSVYLFDAPRLLAEQRERGVRGRHRIQHPNALWTAAENLPNGHEPTAHRHAGASGTAPAVRGRLGVGRDPAAPR